MWSRSLGRTGYPTRSENIGGPARASSIRHVNVGGTGPLAPSRGSKNDIAASYSLGQTSDVGCNSAAARPVSGVLIASTTRFTNPASAASWVDAAATREARSTSTSATNLLIRAASHFRRAAGRHGDGTRASAH